MLWLHLCILSGAISPLISSSILRTYQPGEFIFQRPIFLPFHTAHGVLKARIMKWFAIPFSSGPCFARTLQMTHPSWVALHSMALPIRTRPTSPLSQSPIRKLPKAPYPSPSEERQNENHNHRKLIKLVTWTTALSNSMKLGVMPCRVTQDKWVMMECSDKTWSTGERNGKPLQNSCLENLMNSMTRQTIGH